MLFGLYLGGIVGALVAALALRRTVTKGRGMGFMMEMPRYQMPILKNLLLGLWQRAWVFLKRAGTIIAVTTMILWALLNFPRVDPASGVSQVDHSIAGHIANGLAVVVEPIGFNRDISLAPDSGNGGARSERICTGHDLCHRQSGQIKRDQTLGERLKGSWSLPTALAFTVWFVFAPQCISTIAIVRPRDEWLALATLWWPICLRSPMSQQGPHSGLQHISDFEGTTWRAASTR